MADAPYKLILLRHGESEWNAKNLFTGWVDVNLTEKGEKEAVRGGELLKDAGLLPDVLHTSLQKRAIRTAQLALESADRHWIPVHRSWRLNERHYGALQGKDKAQTLAEYGTPAPVSAVVQELVSALLARGKGEMDYSALGTVLLELAGVETPRSREC